MKKLILFLLPIFALAQNPTNFPYGIKNAAGTTDTTPAFFVTSQTDGVHKKTAAALIAKTSVVNDSLALKQNKITGLTTNFIPKANGSGGFSNSKFIELGGNVGLGSATTPGELFHIGDGNMLLEGGGEVAQKIKRDFTTTGENLGVPSGSGTSVNPIFQIGRIIQAGDGDPEIRIMYSDDNTSERTVFEVDRKGIAASVKTGVGSHFEGFASLTDINPMFRLNSYPRMRLEMGGGGNSITDVAVERSSTGGLDFLTNNINRGGFNNQGDLVLNGTATASPATLDAQLATLGQVKTAYGSGTVNTIQMVTSVGNLGDSPLKSNNGRVFTDTDDGTSKFSVSTNGIGISASADYVGISAYGGDTGIYVDGGNTGVSVIGGDTGVSASGGITGVSASGGSTGVYANGNSAGVYAIGGDTGVNSSGGITGVSASGGSTGVIVVGGDTAGVFNIPSTSTTNTIADFKRDGSTKVSINGDGKITATAYNLSALNIAPTSATSTGTLGEVRVTATYIYVCIATNTWVRTALTTW